MKKIKVGLLAIFLILTSLYLYIKFNTGHGINEINPETGVARLTEECQNRTGYIIVFMGIFVCS